MKITKRKIASSEVAIRISPPQFMISGGKRIPIISWGDRNANPRRNPCAKELFRVVAGNNEVGERPDGLDRLSNHTFVLHFDGDSTCIGIDIIPSRMYGSKVVPSSLIGVSTLKLSFADDGSGVVRVLQRPVNTKPDLIMAIIRGLENADPKDLKVGFRPLEKNSATVIGLGDGTVELRLSKQAAKAPVHDDLGD